MKLYFFKSVIAYTVITFLYGCSFNDLSNMWPSTEPDDEEVVIREIPSDSFDPEESEDMTMKEIDTGSNETPDITIVEEESDIINAEESIETILTETEENMGDVPSITNGRTEPVFTYVGQRIIEMRDEYNKLNQEISFSKNGFEELKSNGIKSAETYHSIVAAIAARLQIGTTPGNPILLSQYEDAQTELANVGAQGQNLVDVGNQVSLLSTRVSYLLEQARSVKKLRGAVDEDHRNLSSFQDDLKRRSVDVIRILEELNETVRRRDIFLAAERRRLTQLANAISVGESFGLGLGTVKSLPATDENNKEDQRSDVSVSPSPIAIIRINELEKYQQSLYGAVSAALDKSPNTKFTLVAVSSSAGNASEQAERAANAKLNANKVVSSLISMGMPADRLSVSTLSLASVENTEVRLYAD